MYSSEIHQAECSDDRLAIWRPIFEIIFIPESGKYQEMFSEQNLPKCKTYEVLSGTSKFANCHVYDDPKCYGFLPSKR